MFMPFVMIEQRSVAVIERFGRYNREMAPGLSFKWPIIETVAYVHSLKENVLDIDS